MELDLDELFQNVWTGPHVLFPCHAQTSAYTLVKGPATVPFLVGARIAHRCPRELEQFRKQLCDGEKPSEVNLGPGNSLLPKSLNAFDKAVGITSP